MEDPPITEVVNVPKPCEHPSLSLERTSKRQGSGIMMVTDNVVCQACGAKLYPISSKGVGSKLTTVYSETPPRQAVQARPPRPTVPGTSAALRERKAAAAPAGKGAGTELLRINARFGFRGCNLCKELAAKMDANGSAWCREHFDELATEILGNARKYHENAETLAARLSGRAVNLVPDDVLMVGIRHNLTAAIEAAEAQQKEKPNA